MCALHPYFIAVIQQFFEKNLKPCVFCNEAQQIDTMYLQVTSFSAIGRYR